jgi:hypothetical protein
MGTPSKWGLDNPSAASSTRSPHSISMIRVLKVIHYFTCVFGYFCWGPNWPLGCNNPPNGQISPYGDTKQMRPWPFFLHPHHTLTALFCRNSSSLSHPSLYVCVWLLQLWSDWPLGCNNSPNGQISPYGDTKQMGPRQSFLHPKHTLTALYFHDSSSQSHPLLYMCVWLLLLGS